MKLGFNVFYHSTGGKTIELRTLKLFMYMPSSLSNFCLFDMKIGKYECKLLLHDFFLFPFCFRYGVFRF